MERCKRGRGQQSQQGAHRLGGRLGQLPLRLQETEMCPYCQTEWLQDSTWQSQAKYNSTEFSGSRTDASIPSAGGPVDPNLVYALDTSTVLGEGLKRAAASLQRNLHCSGIDLMDDGEFGEGDEYADQQENAEERLSGSVHGSSARSVSWAEQWTAALDLQGNGSRREGRAWSWVEEERDRGGGADKILVPEFLAESDRDGVKAWGYLRKVEAWRRAAKVKGHKQAVEVIKVGKYMTDLFKNLKKHHNQDVKEFNQEFDRQSARLKEVGCALPDICLAWWYMDKLRLNNATELNLLSSTGNDYNLYKLQDTAIIQDRMNSYGSMTPRTVEGVDEEVEEAYVTYQNAKSKYKTIMNARGANPRANQEERIKAAKARSYCSAHKDPECPLSHSKNHSGERREAHQVKFCHVAYMVNDVKDTELYGITDCACSRTVAGRPWLCKMARKAKANNIPHFFIAQDEKFKFGGPDCRSRMRAAIALSRNVLAGLGMCYDISRHVGVKLGHGDLAAYGSCDRE
ncbi:unnamed protein product [Effrenium voratum]|nr:unnamed protein product [Effrenium voratum]